MPNHLEELVLSKTAEERITQLHDWLKKNGQYAPVATTKYFDECVTEGWERETYPLGHAVVRPITNVIVLPKSPHPVLTVEQEQTICGIAKPRDENQGGWLVNEHEQCVVSIKVPDKAYI